MRRPTPTRRLPTFAIVAPPTPSRPPLRVTMGAMNMTPTGRITCPWPARTQLGRLRGRPQPLGLVPRPAHARPLRSNPQAGRRRPRSRYRHKRRRRRVGRKEFDVLSGQTRACADDVGRDARDRACRQGRLPVDVIVRRWVGGEWRLTSNRWCSSRSAARPLTCLARCSEALRRRARRRQPTQGRHRPRARSREGAGTEYPVARALKSLVWPDFSLSLPKGRGQKLRRGEGDSHSSCHDVTEDKPAQQGPPLFAALFTMLVLAAPAGASSWFEAGGGPGNAGVQPVDPGDAPFYSAYWSNASSDQWIMNSPVVTGGAPASQRVGYGTLNGAVHVQELLTGAPVGAQSGANVDSAPTTTSTSSTARGAAATRLLRRPRASGRHPLPRPAQRRQPGRRHQRRRARADRCCDRERHQRPGDPRQRRLDVASSPVLSDPDVNGHRYLFFAATNGGGGWLGKIQIANATGSNPTLGMTRGRGHAPQRRVEPGDRLPQRRGR